MTIKQLIKNAIVYKAEVPKDADQFDAHLEDHRFTEMTPGELRSVGFVPVDSGDQLAKTFHGGFAFSIRIDQKIIPGHVLRREIDKRAEAISQGQGQGRKVGRVERRTIKDEALCDLAAIAFPKTAIITCFYEFSTGYLIVPTTSKGMADIAISTLVLAVGSVKTETINVSNVRHGITRRMGEWVNENEDAFGRFNPCSAVALKEDKRSIVVQMGDLDSARAGIKEALSSSFQVTSLGLTLDGDTQFRLTDEFRLKRIEFAHVDKADEDAESSFAAEAALEVAALSEVITVLCEMLSYDTQQAEDAKKETAE